MFKYVIFDVDGTILDTEKSILKSLQKVLEDEGETYSPNELRFALGIPGKDALKKLNIDNLDRVQSKWSQTVLEFSSEVQVFHGIKEIIETLSQQPIKLGIVTSKTKQEIIDEFDPFGLSHFFDCIISASDTENHKPHPDPLLFCLKELGADKNDTVYIGDSIYDMQSAKSAGIKFALALWGSKTIKGFETADYILNKPRDILTLN
ncbi:HAD family hydrolase [Virgibacillus sp. MSJ-26]|uniref:HAD family hydrolase n=1 Tax=Virgibacillus sp. MSJ-26 TaxID=2841522 RepID=UPI001C1024A4|nr:HAD family hydrolase [Virgibacillus sp. MSJ-26]MBU5467935.1 HAD family hydrolase [Virgibacillus sp. MSJ-26]